MPRLFARLLVDEDGQDLIEYSLLAAFIGFAGLTVWQNVGVGIMNAYTGWDTGVQTLSSCTPDPISTGGGSLGC